jgi:hypothetical protein
MTTIGHRRKLTPGIMIWLPADRNQFCLLPRLRFAPRDLFGAVCSVTITGRFEAGAASRRVICPMLVFGTPIGGTGQRPV